MLAIPFPALDPVLVTFGPLAIRWYALAYLAGFVIAWRMMMWLAKQNPDGPSPQAFDDYMTWAVIGTILGGRLGYVLFYNFDQYLQEPLNALKVWEGGMSFHGGMLGVILAAILFTRKRKIPFFAFSDLMAVVTPIGLFFGRLANFINGELYGRVTDVPWGIVFPRGGDLPRHPSQLYEAGLEGLVLFAALFALSQIKLLRSRYGFISGLFLMDYALFRIVAEFFREPDVQIGFLAGGVTMGQLLSVPMMIAGAIIVVYSLRPKT